jgi:hypothetical protein
LNEYEEHKKFLYGIFKKENPKWHEKQEKIREKKYEREKKKWIEYAKLHRDSVEEEDRLI